jgi:hypothetical protein
MPAAALERAAAGLARHILSGAGVAPRADSSHCAALLFAI